MAGLGWAERRSLDRMSARPYPRRRTACVFIANDRPGWPGRGGLNDEASTGCRLGLTPRRRTACVFHANDRPGWPGRGGLNDEASTGCRLGLTPRRRTACVFHRERPARMAGPGWAERRGLDRMSARPHSETPNRMVLKGERPQDGRAPVVPAYNANGNESPRSAVAPGASRTPPDHGSARPVRRTPRRRSVATARSARRRPAACSASARLPAR